MEGIPMLLGDIVFDAKPDAVPYNYRISYKVSQLCLIMHICGWRDACSLIKLHMISFALFSQENMRRLIKFTEGMGNIPLVRFDPAVNRALAYAIAYGFIEQQKTDNFKLTDHGKKLAEQIMLVSDLMVTEISDLKILAKNLTEGKIKELVEKWRD
jgi:hypothetical protein